MNVFSGNKLRAAWNSILRLLGGKRPPEADPHAYVTAPRKPRSPQRSAAAVADPPD